MAVKTQLERKKICVLSLVGSLLLIGKAATSSAPTPSQWGLYTVTPCRAVDTRNPNGPYGGPALSANSDRSFVIAGQCGVPATADAVALNVTVTGPTSGGDVRIYPGGTPLPMASAVNYAAGRTRANNGIYGLGASGDLVVHCDQTSGATHLIFDVFGYFDFEAESPPPSWTPWSKSYGGSGSDGAKSVVVDGGGNVVVAGQYQGVVNFGAGLVTSYTPAGSGATIDAFVAKYSSSMAPVWSRSIGGDGSDMGYGVAVDSAGSMVVTGYQGSSAVDYGGGMLGNRGNSDIFVAKYSTSGGYLWAKTVGGTGADGGSGVAVDGGGSVYVTGQIDVSASGVDFGGGGPLSSAGAKDVFLVKYSSAGGHLWSKRFGSSGFELGGPVAVDSAGNVVVAGTFEGTINLGDSNLTSVGVRDLFVAKFSPTGQHLWSKSFGGTSTDWVRGIAVDGGGNVVLTGQFMNTISFGGSALTSAGYEDVFVAKLSGVNGGHLWSRRFGSSTTTDAGYGVAVDGVGNVAVTGYFAQDVDFGGGTIYAQGYDIFVAKYSSSTGAYISARRLGDPPGYFDLQFGDAIAMNSSGNVLLAGHFVGTLELGAAGRLTSNPAGGTDAFLASVGP